MSAACCSTLVRTGTRLPGHETDVEYPNKLSKVQHLVLPGNSSVALGRAVCWQGGRVILGYERLLQRHMAPAPTHVHGEEGSAVPVRAIKIKPRSGADVRGEPYSHSGASIMMGAVTEVVRSVSSKALAPEE